MPSRILSLLTIDACPTSYVFSPTESLPTGVGRNLVLTSNVHNILSHGVMLARDFFDPFPRVKPQCHCPCISDAVK
jgi:hypothetical protein